jgi:predicted RNA binding protein with dsRBD fold (UPF0201 family)
VAHCSIGALKQVLSAIENLFMHEVLENEAPDWSSILRCARKFDANLAKVLKHALKPRAVELAAEVIEDARQGGESGAWIRRVS